LRDRLTRREAAVPEASPDPTRRFL